MFLGEFEHNIDAKNRLRIPSKFSKDFADGMVLTKGSDGCLFLISKTHFSEILEKTANLPMFDGKVQQSIRLLFSSAVEVEEDNQGRFLLPNSLKNFAKINKQIVFIGAGSRVELWSSESWAEYKSKINSNFDQIMSNLGEYGI